MQKPEASVRCLPQSLPTLFFKQGLSLNLEFTDSAGLAGNKPLVSISLQRDCKGMLLHLLFCKGAEI